MYDNEWPDERALIIWPEVHTRARGNKTSPATSVDAVLGDLVDRWDSVLNADERAVDVCVLSDDYSLDAALAQFINDLARQAGNQELVDRTGRLILQLKQRDVDNEALMRRQIEVDSQREATRRVVVNFCYEAFFKRRIVALDLSSYTARIESARMRLEGTDAARLLDNYFDPEKKLLQVYEGVRDSLTSRFTSPGAANLPTDEDLQSIAVVVMADIHRRAEIYLLGKLG